MAQMRNALRALTTATSSPGEALSAFNDYTCAQLDDEMATVVFLEIDPASRIVRYASAGHPPPLLIHGAQGPLYLRDALGPPVCVLPGHRYLTASVRIDDPVCLVAYTDGLVERRGEPIDVGLGRLQQVAGSQVPDAERLCAELVKRLLGDEDLSDDAVVLVATADQG
jgi:serine phosphatase RsbU (regulator of sigma subunit)